MRFAVIVATRNGEKVLPRTLGGYRRQQTSVDWNLVVVNNGSTDRTAKVLEEFQPELPLTVLHHEKSGKNGALNAAIKRLHVDFIILTDDDAVPCEEFISGWADIAQTQSQYNLFGGAIRAEFLLDPPRWMADTAFHFEELYAARDLPEGEIDGTKIFGPNMAVRRGVFDEGFWFNEDIGPNGDPNYPMGGETEFCRRLTAAGHRAWFTRRATVTHLVRPYQIEAAFVRGRAYRHGLGFGLQEVWRDPSARHRTAMTAKHLAKQASLLPKRFLDWRKAARMEAFWQMNWNRGYHRARILPGVQSLTPPK